MSPHQSSHSKSTPSKSSSTILSKASWRHKVHPENSRCTCHAVCSTSIQTELLLDAGEPLEYDMSPHNNYANHLSYYEIKTKQRDGSRGEIEGSCKSNNADSHTLSYPKRAQSYCQNPNYSYENRLWSTEGTEMRHNGSKHSAFHGIPFYTGGGGRGYGRPICWNRRKVRRAMYSISILTNKNLSNIFLKAGLI